MKRAVSISIGSSQRDKAVEIDLLGERVRIERIGTDGDMEKAARIFQELDGKVDAFGLGGTDLGLRVEGRWYPLYSVQKIVRFVHKTPLVDGAGWRNAVESRLAQFVDQRLGGEVEPRRALITSGADRWSMAMSFYEAGYACIFGDLMFALGLPIRLHSRRSLRILAALMLPVVGRLPFEWIYPIGEKQEKRTPKWGADYAWATVIAGDGHYVKRFMPERLDGKIIVTNTTTEKDTQLFRQAGVKYVVTSTPVLDGRSFGTNMMEAALTAAAGKGRVLQTDELRSLVDRLGIEPQLNRLN